MFLRFILLAFAFMPLILAAQKPFAIVVHGGAGLITRENVSAADEKAYRADLKAATDAGYLILEKGGSAAEAVEAAVKVLEDSPLFNAGKGAVLNEEGRAELDASFMDGKTGLAGAVAGVRTVKNPVSLARAVAEKSPHVFLMSDGAAAFARKLGMEIAAPNYFITPKRLEQWKQWKDKGVIKLDHSDSTKNSKHGTVGAVALDKEGNLAAATSTGGMSNKWLGRVGDSPMIGAGNYAENGVCAVSCTGHGEYFIRKVAAYDVAARMKYAKNPLKLAAEAVIFDVLKNIHGEGGLIAIDSEGNFVMPFNTAGMLRGYRHSDGRSGTALFAE